MHNIKKGELRAVLWIENVRIADQNVTQNKYIGSTLCKLFIITLHITWL